MMQIAIPDEVTVKLEAQAQVAQVDAKEYAIQLLRAQLASPTAVTQLPFALSLSESELLQRINQGLAEETWARYERLKDKREADSLTADEYEELLAISDELEQFNAERIRALGELAVLRHVSLEALMASLGINTPSYV
jgi:hypothetical protein